MAGWRILVALVLALLAMLAQGKTLTVQLKDSNYKTLLSPGQKVGATVFGQLLDRDGQAILANDYEAGLQLDKPDISTAPDHTAIVQVGKELFATVLTDFFPPSTHYVAKLTQNSAGNLKVTSLKPVDWSRFGGIWLPCSGDVVASKGKATVLNGEEYETNARHIATSTSLAELKALFETDPYYYGYADVVNHMRYFGKYPFANNLSLPVVTIDDIKTLFKPYLYGYITSLEVRPGGKTRTNKLLTMGRASHELGYVMPDRKTVYLTDDHGTGGGIFKFVASKAGDFTSGQLFAMKAMQTVPAGTDPLMATFDVSWVELGSATNAKLLARASNTTFLDIFDIAAGNSTSGACPAGFSSVNTATGFECLKLKAGMALEAAFFETRRYAALLGATVEFSKAEGLAYDAATKSVYIAMSSVRYGMEDYGRRGRPSTLYDAGGPNHIKLAYNQCGCIFNMTVNPKVYSGTHMSVAVCGVASSSSTCADTSIAGPDNLDVVRGQLVIAEDSEGFHPHNMMWALDLSTKALTRVFSMPANGATYSEAEFTSTYMYTAKDRAYLVANINNWDMNGGVPGRVGYFGPFKLAKGDKLNFTAYEPPAIVGRRHLRVANDEV